MDWLEKDLAWAPSHGLSGLVMWVPIFQDLHLGSFAWWCGPSVPCAIGESKPQRPSAHPASAYLMLVVNVLLTKTNFKASPDSRSGTEGAPFCWEET